MEHLGGRFGAPRQVQDAAVRQAFKRGQLAFGAVYSPDQMQMISNMYALRCLPADFEMERSHFIAVKAPVKYCAWVSQQCPVTGRQLREDGTALAYQLNPLAFPELSVDQNNWKRERTTTW